MDASVALPMNAIRQKYVQNLMAQREDISRLAGTVPDARPEDFEGLRTFAHRLAGTGKIYGFPEISEAGYSLECSLRQDEIAPADVSRKTKYLLSVIERAIRSADSKESAINETTSPGEHAQPAAPVARTTDPSRPVMLVIDDDEGITDLVHSLFGQTAQVIACPDVASGLLAACEMQPQLILLDEQMPGERSGLDLLQQLRAMPVTGSIPIVMMSANDSLSAIMQALVAGATDYMIKPFEPLALLTKGLELLKTFQTRILVVDDDVTVRDLLQYKLSSAGCQVVTVGDCHAAWELLEKESFSLVLLDRMMPDLDGSILLRMMHGDETTARIPVVFLTARRSAADVVDGLLTGAADYITKPFDPDDVVKRCIALIKAKRH